MTKLQAEILAVQKLKEELTAQGELDPQLTHDMIEGSTNFLEMLDWLLGKIREEEAMEEVIKKRIETLSQRKKSCEQRANYLRLLILNAMNAVGEKTLRLAEGSLSVATTPQKVQLADETKLPKEYIKIEEKPDLTKILQDLKNGVLINGATLSNGGQTLKIR